MEDNAKEEALNYLLSNSLVVESGCREWQGPVTKDGYGQVGPRWIVDEFGLKGVHRLMVHLAQGVEFTSRRQVVMHSCHNRRCCNPEHLSVGTPAENSREACLRGSMANKLSPNDVRMIRLMSRMGVTGTKIAPLFGVGDSAIYAVLSGTSWTHVPQDRGDIVEALRNTLPVEDGLEAFADLLRKLDEVAR